MYYSFKSHNVIADIIKLKLSMKEIWSYFSLFAQCTECKLEIVIHSAAFSVLFAHLRLEHNIILEDTEEVQRCNELKQVFKEEVLEDADNEDQDTFDHDGKELDGDLKPKCIQILKVKQEDDNEKFEEETYLEEDHSRESNTLDTSRDSRNNEHFDAENQLKRKKRKRIKEVRKEEDYFDQSNDKQSKRTIIENYTGEVFNKFDHFVVSNEDEENSEMICKYCEERISSKLLTIGNRLIKLKRHMLTMHEEKLDPSLVDFLNRQFENARRKKKEYKMVNKEAIKKKERERNYRLDPDTGKVVNIKSKNQDLKRQIHKCPYEGCTQDAVSAFGLQAHIRARHTKEKPFQCSDCGKRFNLNSQLMNHKRVHSDEANFPCQYCEKRYKNYSGVVKHQTAGRGCEGLKRLQALGQLVPESRNYGNQ